MIILRQISILLLFIAPSCLPPGSIDVAKLGPSDNPLVVQGRSRAGTEYILNGRQTERWPGLDCMGLVFRSYEDVHRSPWRTHSINPTELIRNRSLGVPVQNLDGVGTNELAYDSLVPGDIIFILRSQENPKEPSIVSIDGVPQWVWHMGIYTGGKNYGFLHADPYHGRSHEVPLNDYLNNFWTRNSGIFVVRPRHR